MDLTANNLKSQLWQTLLRLQESKVDPATADSIAAQAREILRTTNTQLKIFQHAHKALPEGMIKFASE